MHRNALVAILAALVVAIFASPARAEDRVALVVGNGNYARAPRLPNPLNDAEDVAAALKRSGFEIIVATNLDKAGMEEAMIKFARAARSADVALFYYSGHALQFGGINYLVPVDAQLNDEADRRRLVRLDDVVADVQQAKNLRIVVLDSCRDNPLADHLKRSIGVTRSAYVGRGLARMDSPLGTIISYATQAGRTADDGDGRNSPFTAAFLKHVEAREEIGTIFRRVGAEVYQATRQKQLPELSLSLIGEFYLNGKTESPPPKAMLAPVDPCDDASRHWQMSEVAATRSAYEDHIARFPTCSFANFARAKIVALATPAPDKQRFDGVWAGKLVCEGVTTAPGWKYDLIGRVTNGSFHAAIGQAGKPGSEVFKGSIEPDGSAAIIQKGLTGSKDPYHRLPGTEFGNRYYIIFDGRRASGVRSDRPNCYIDLTKR